MIIPSLLRKTVFTFFCVTVYPFAGAVSSSQTVAETIKSVSLGPADLKTCSGIVTKMTKTKVWTGPEYAKQISTKEGVNLQAKYLGLFGNVKGVERWQGHGPLVSAARNDDFASLVGKPICLEDPDDDHF